MIAKPGAGDGALVRHLEDLYGLEVSEVAFLNLGADADAAAYRVVADTGVHFLKLRRGGVDTSKVELQDFLARAGAARVVAPVPDRHGRLVTDLDGHAAVLQPFVEGRSGFETELTPEQWTELGASVRALHEIGDLPTALRASVRVETYGGEWRDKVRARLASGPPEQLPDAPARGLAALLVEHHRQLSGIVARAERLAAVLRDRGRATVLCHGDLHGGNVMAGDDGSLTVVDWDDPVLAPRERDLMFVGGGVGGTWNRAEECAAFYRGYGRDGTDGAPDRETLAYYRLERIVQDVAEFCDALLSGEGDDGSVTGADDRAQNLRHFAGQFRPGNVIDIAERTYAAL
ncbi:phosphotransferase enzyme family protein [Streptomyces sp. NPDC054796]